MTCILIIDDEISLVLSLKIALEKEGYKVISALNGIEGLELAKSFRPDLILLDISMPYFDGWMTLKEIKSDPTLAPIPVIMLTAITPKTDILKRKSDLEFYDYITKPYEINEIFTRINEAIQSSSENNREMGRYG